MPRIVACCSLLLVIATIGASELALNAIFTDHMVLQRERPVPVWGTGTPGSEVTVAIAGSEANGTCDEHGAWRLELPALKAGGPHELSLRSADQTITVKDVLIGDVWLCSGQSNMQWSVNRSNDAKAEVAAAKHPRIRLLQVNNSPAISPAPQSAINGSWRVCSPASVPGFSAVGYFFGRSLQQELDVPIGLIANAWGGTAIEVWMDLDRLEAHPDQQKHRAAYAELGKDREALQGAHDAQMARWEAISAQLLKHSTGEEAGWATPAHDDSTWQPMELPNTWEHKGLNIDGAVWFRTRVTIPEDLAGKAIRLQLGAIDDFDISYWDGTRIGSIDDQVENHWQVQRDYPIPAELVTAGEHVIAVRAIDNYKGGGFFGPASQMRILGPEGATIPLAGEWLFRVEYSMTKDEIRPEPLDNGGVPRIGGSLYYSRICTVAPFALRGVIWYQGESNAWNAYRYRDLLQDMILDWRQRWGIDDLPFLTVQLANFKDVSEDPGPSAWAELREAQLRSLELPKTGLAVTIDIGDAKDIHPRNKQDVGKRLAAAALNIAYGQTDVVPSGPLYREMAIENSHIRIRFDHATGLATSDDGPVKQVAIAGADQVFHWAQARIDGSDLIVWSEDVPEPKAVRYAWADNPAGCNLINAAGLPASPFRTDDWKGQTQR